MKKIGYISIICFIIFLILLSFSSPVYAEHSTCNEDYSQYHGSYAPSSNCDLPMDWDDMFSEIDLGGNTVADNGYGEYRILYQEASTMMDSPEKLRESFYTYASYTSASRNPNLVIEGDDVDNTIELDKHHTYYSTPESGIFNPDTLRANIKLPEGTLVTFRIYNEEGDLATIESINSEDNPRRDMSMRNINLDIPESQQSEEYTMELYLAREDAEIETPEVDEVIVMYENVPEYRYSAESFERYPDYLESYQDSMYSSYDNTATHRTHRTIDTVTSPRYSEDEYYNFAVASEKYEDSRIMDFLSSFFGNDKTGVPVRHSYIDVNKIEPSVNVPTDSRTIGNSWDTVIGDEGQIHIAYGGAIGDVPDDDNDFGGLTERKQEGSKEWEYSKNTLEFDINVEFEYQDGSFYRGIDSETFDDTGIYTVDYDIDDYENKDDITAIRATKTVEATFDKTIYEYYQPTSPCPSAASVADDDDYTDYDSFNDFLSATGIDDVLDDINYSANTPRGCNDPDDEYDDGPLETRYYDSEIVSFESSPYQYEKSIDAQDIRGFASDDGPEENDDNFDIQIANYGDETRMFVDIEDVQGNENSPQNPFTESNYENRWTNIAFSGIMRNGNINIDSNRVYTDQIPIGTQSTINNPKYTTIEDESEAQTLNSEITEDMDVYLSAWASGDLGENPEISVEIGDSTINVDTLELSQNQETIDTLLYSEDISEFVHGTEDQIDLSFDIDNIPDEKNSQPRIDYSITIDLDKPVSRVSSKWNYWFFRDSHWDGIEQINEDCSDRFRIRDCFDYDDEPPESTGIIPIQAHLLPSKHEMGINSFNMGDSNEINIIENSEENQRLRLPISSPNCPHHPDYDNERICNVYNNTIVDDINAEDISIDEENEDMTESDKIRDLLGFDVPDFYEPLYDESNRDFKQPTQFEIVSDTPIQNPSVSGNISWTYSDMDVDNVRNVQETRLDVTVIPQEELTDDFVEEERTNIGNNNQLKRAEQLDNNEIQLKVELTDSRSNPIDTNNRNTDEIILVENGDLQDISDIINDPFDLSSVILDDEQISDVLETYREIDTNEDGMAYVTVHNLFEDDIDDGEVNNINLRFISEEEWWNVPEDTRLLTSSSTTFSQDSNPYDDESNEEEPDLSFYDIVTSVLFVFAASFFIAAMAMRIHPSSNMTTVKLFSIMLDPVKEQLKESIKYLILVILFSFILLMFIIVETPT